MIVDEPWMLDKVANEERLEMSFDELFQEEINNTLPGYLRQIYQFFGLWVGVIGLFIFLFARTSLTNISKVRISLLICIGTMVWALQRLACRDLEVEFVLKEERPRGRLGEHRKE